MDEKLQACCVLPLGSPSPSLLQPLALLQPALGATCSSAQRSQLPLAEEAVEAPHRWSRQESVMPITAMQPCIVSPCNVRSIRYTCPARSSLEQVSSAAGGWVGSGRSRAEDRVADVYLGMMVRAVSPRDSETLCDATTGDRPPARGSTRKFDVNRVRKSPRL